MKITAHARQRMDEMGVPEEEVVAVVAEPELDYPCHQRYGAGRRTCIAGRLAIIVGPEPEPVVITVLWRGDYSRDRAPQ